MIYFLNSNSSRGQGNEDISPIPRFYCISIPIFPKGIEDISINFLIPHTLINTMLIYKEMISMNMLKSFYGINYSKSVIARPERVCHCERAKVFAIVAIPQKESPTTVNIRPQLLTPYSSLLIKTIFPLYSL